MKPTSWTRSSRRLPRDRDRGTGLGHVNKPLYPALQRAIAAGVHVWMTVQTLWGYAQCTSTTPGRDLLDLGIVPSTTCSRRPRS